MRQLIIAISAAGLISACGQADRPAASPTPAANRTLVASTEHSDWPRRQPPERQASCKRLDIGDPVQAARKAVAADDYRVFTHVSLSPDERAPGLYCPDRRRPYVSRGGAYTSDVPSDTRCQAELTGEEMIAYNREIASTKLFQEVSGCLPASRCEYLYRVQPYPPERGRLDRECIAEPNHVSAIALYGTTEDLAEALRLGASPQGVDTPWGGRTVPLAAAAEGNRLENARLLLKAGANPQGLPRRSPLRTAIGSGNGSVDRQPMIQLLLAHGADPNPGPCMMNGDDSPLGFAAARGDEKSVDLLLKAGARIQGNQCAKSLEFERQWRPEAAEDHPTSQTPFMAAIQASLTSSGDPEADARSRAARRIALTLYRRGEGPLGAKSLASLARQNDPKSLSIVLAGARRHGRYAEALALMLQGARRFDDPQIAKSRPWLEALAACRRRTFRVEEDFVQLCLDPAARL